MAIESQSIQVKQLGDELDGLVTKSSSQVPIVNGVNTRSEFILTVQALRREAQVILDNAPKFIDAVDRLSADMREGRQSFSAAAKLFETFAAEEPYESIADDYRQIVKMFTTLSERCETAQSQIIEKHDRAAFLDTIQFLKHQELLLHRLEAALLATFENADVLEVQRYLAQVTSYTRRYEDFRLQIRDLNRLVPMLQAESIAVPPKPKGQSSPKTPPAAASDSPKNSVADHTTATEHPTAADKSDSTPKVVDGAAATVPTASEPPRAATPSSPTAHAEVALAPSNTPSATPQAPPRRAGLPVHERPGVGSHPK